MIKAVRFCRAAFSFSPDRKGDVRGTAFKVKASRNCSSFLRNISLNSALSRRRLKPSALCASSRSFFPQKKRRHPNALRTTAAVCGAQLRERVKHAEKETGEKWGKLACIHFLRFFFDIDCRDKTAATFQHKRRFFGTFLTQESTVPPRPPSSPYSFSTMFVSVCKPTANPCELSSR